MATAITKLAGAAGVNGPMLRIDNNNGANATALDLRVESGKPPMKVNSDAQVANLNADSLDGLDSADFEVGCPAGTQLLGSGCIETASRVQANFDAASEEGNRVMEKERIPYDYLILGAGSAGCTLANRLTEEATFMAEDGSLGLISEGGRFLVSVPEEHAFRAALPGVGNLAYSCLFTLPKNNR